MISDAKKAGGIRSLLGQEVTTLGFAMTLRLASTQKPFNSGSSHGFGTIFATKPPFIGALVHQPCAVEAAPN